MAVIENGQSDTRHGAVLAPGEQPSAAARRLGWDRLMFSTDYPHWDFDHPQEVLKFRMTEAQKAMVLRDNAKALYGLQ